MQDFADFVDTVEAMISDFGGEAILISQANTGGYDPSIGSGGAETEDIIIKGILLDLTLRSNGAGTKDKTLIQDGDKVFYAKPSYSLMSTLMPDGILVFDSTDDRVVTGGVTYKVSTVKIVDPASTGLPLLFELYLRR